MVSEGGTREKGRAYSVDMVSGPLDGRKEEGGKNMGVRGRAEEAGRCPRGWPLLAQTPVCVMATQIHAC